MFDNYGFCYLLLLCSLQQSMGGRTQDGYLWHDEPDIHEQGITYEKLGEVFQSVPVDRRNMDKYSFWNVGVKSCEDFVGYREYRHHDSHFSGYYIDKKKPCYSVLRNCRVEPILHDYVTISFCPSDAKDRMYDYVEAEKISIQKNRAWWGKNDRKCELERYDTVPNRPCICDCESNEQLVDRYFSLTEMLADDDKVVTGVSFRKSNHVFQIEIQQGTLGPNLTIIGESQWKGVLNDWQSNDDNLLSISHYRKEGEDNVLEFHRDDHWYAITGEQNTILLDDVEAGYRKVVTGVKFAKSGNDLILEIQVKPFDLETGNFTIPKGESPPWIGNTLMDKSRRKEVKLGKRNIPSNGTLIGSISPKGTYVKFQTSNFENDLGQTTVPFIDIQDVVNERPSPLFGIGIFHKGNADSAGYIALRGKYF